MEAKADFFTESSWSSIINAKKIAQNLYHQYIETEHLLLSMINESDLTIKILTKNDVCINVGKHLCIFQ